MWHLEGKQENASLLTLAQQSVAISDAQLNWGLLFSTREPKISHSCMQD